MPRTPPLVFSCLLPMLAFAAGAQQEDPLTCLGTGEPAARAARLAQPPVVVPPPVIEPPRTAQKMPPAPPSPPVTVARPPMVTTCDTGGCWTSDGTRLQHAGPNLVGPQGVCTVQGALAYCP